ncbi:MAG: hypothetical protein HGA54_08040, partial [Actinobacteria bacterium]|nr:hypothetical protein [Actinomycetota bacterium]
MARTTEEFELEEDFDPLYSDDENGDDIEEIEIEDIGTFKMPTQEEIAALLAEEANLCPEEKIERLLERMSGRRRVLLEILASCKEPQPISILSSKIDALQENNTSVFTPATLCLRLEEVGALELSEVQEVEPLRVEEDGREYLVVNKAPEGMWKSTRAGLAVLERDKPKDRLSELFETDKQYIEIYKRILAYCDDAPRDK